MIAVKHYLDSFDPKLWYFAIVIVANAALALWRKFHTASFDALPDRVKGLPAVLISLIVSSSSSANLKELLANAIIGVFAGLTAVGGYEQYVRLTSGSGTRDSGKVEAATDPPAAADPPDPPPPDKGNIS